MLLQNLKDPKQKGKIDMKKKKSNLISALEESIYMNPEAKGHLFVKENTDGSVTLREIPRTCRKTIKAYKMTSKTGEKPAALSDIVDKYVGKINIGITFKGDVYIELCPAESNNQIVGTVEVVITAKDSSEFLDKLLNFDDQDFNKKTAELFYQRACKDSNKSIRVRGTTRYKTLKWEIIQDEFEVSITEMYSLYSLIKLFKSIEKFLLPQEAERRKKK